MNDSKNRKLGAILSYVSIVATTIVQLIYTPFLIRMLGQSEYGLYSLVYSIIGYLTILDLGFGNAIVVYTSKYRAQKKYDEEKKLHGMFFLIFCIIGAVAGLIGIVLYFNVNNLFGATMTTAELSKAKIMMIILTINIVLTFIFNIYTSILNAYEKFVYQKVISLLNTILRPLMMIPLLFLGFKSITMVLVITILNLIIMLSNYLYCRKKLNIKIKYQGFDKTIFKTILGYSIWIFLTIIVDKVNWSLDQFILGTVSGTIAVSIYSVATNFNSLFLNISTALSGVFLPKMSKMISENCTAEKLTDEMIKVGRIQFYIMFLATTGFIMFGKQFIIWWAGKDFKESYYVTLCLICPAFFSLIQNLGLSIMQAMNKYKFKAISTSIGAIFNAIISYFLAIKYGPVGAAFGTTIVLIVCNTILINIYYYKDLKIDVIKFWKNIFMMVIKFIIPLLVTICLIYMIRIDSIVKFVILIVIYVVMYSLVAYKFVLNNYEKSLINSILVKVKRR